MKEFNYENLKQKTRTKKGRAYIAQVEEYYLHNYANKPILALPFYEYKRFELDGDRVAYEAAHSERQKRLFLLQTLALAKDKYLQDLEEVLAAICDQYTWVVPAHACYTVDLVSSYIASVLAETVFVFKDKLSDEIRARIYKSLEDKAIRLYWKT